MKLNLEVKKVSIVNQEKKSLGHFEFVSLSGCCSILPAVEEAITWKWPLYFFKASENYFK